MSEKELMFAEIVKHLRRMIETRFYGDNDREHEEKIFREAAECLQKAEKLR